MKQTKLRILTLILSLTACVILFAEGDKGGGNKPPSKETATEVIKPAVPAAPVISNFSGGLKIPCVTLLNADDLTPYADKQAENYNKQRLNLAGLVVFHTGGGESKLPKGMYVWDGDKWQKASGGL